MGASDLSFAELNQAIFNTLGILAITVALSVPIGTVVALLVRRTNVWGHGWIWLAMASQLAVPLYVFAGGWSAGFGTQGWVTFLRAQGGPGGGGLMVLEGLAALLPVALVHSFAAIPWVMLVVSLGLRRTDRSQEEQALLDGGWWQVLTRSVLPQLRYWLLAAALWCAIPVVTEMVISNLYQVPTLPELVYLDASRGTPNPLTYLNAGILCVLPPALVAAFLLRRYAAWSGQRKSSQFQPQRLDLGVWRAPISLLIWAMTLLLVALPLINLFVKAGWQPEQDAQGRTAYGWSAARLWTTCEESLTLFGDEYVWSLLLAVTSSSAALAIAGLLLAATRGAGRHWGSGLMTLLILIPGPAVGMFVIWLLNRPDPAWLGYLYDRTLAAPALAQQFRLLPMAWILSIVVLQSVADSTWEQAKLDGLSRWQLGRVVLWSQTRGQWLAAWLLLATLSVGELSCTILVLPPGVTTVSMRLFEMLHFGMRHQDSGLCGVLILLGWLVAAGIGKLAFGSTRSDR